MKLLNIVSLLAFVMNLQQIKSDTISEIFGDEYLRRNEFYENGPYGSTRNGVWFTDFWQSLDGRRILPNHWVDGINVRAGGRIDGIQFFYGSYRGKYHGGDGGELHRIRLYESDKIIRVTGRSGIGPGAGVDQLTFHTLNGDTFGPYGGTGGHPFEARPPRSDCYLAWISGRADLRLDSITFHWRCRRLEPIPRQQTDRNNIDDERDTEKRYQVDSRPYTFSGKPRIAHSTPIIAFICFMSLQPFQKFKFFCNFYDP